MEGDLQQKISMVVQKFHTDIFTLLKVLDNKHAGNLDVDRLKRLVRISRDEDPLLIISRCKEKIWESREKILAEDEEFFISKTYDEYVKKDHNQVFIEGLITLIKNGRHLLTKKENAFCWVIIKRLLTSVTEYKILIGDYE